ERVYRDKMRLEAQTSFPNPTEQPSALATAEEDETEQFTEIKKPKNIFGDQENERFEDLI
ncbi:MAG: hypothetical protein K2X47_19695, partial [Bdellovibrionales bacterium]|nr:hypothetical protein [Bdellovibrionales bacterium]